jgi:hypothetical protein
VFGYFKSAAESMAFSSLRFITGTVFYAAAFTPALAGWACAGPAGAFVVAGMAARTTLPQNALKIGEGVVTDTIVDAFKAADRSIHNGRMRTEYEQLVLDGMVHQDSRTEYDNIQSEDPYNLDNTTLTLNELFKGKDAEPLRSNWELLTGDFKVEVNVKDAAEAWANITFKPDIETVRA